MPEGVGKKRLLEMPLIGSYVSVAHNARLFGAKSVDCLDWRAGFVW